MSSNFQKDFIADVSLGRVKGASVIQRFGVSNLITAGVTEGVWPVGGSFTHPADVGETLEAVSASASDTGILNLLYLDSDWNAKEVNFNLTGTTPVAVPDTVSRILRVRYLDPVSAVGVITILGDGTTSTTVFSGMTAGVNEAMSALISIPEGKVGMIIGYAFNVNQSAGALANVIFEGCLSADLGGGVRTAPICELSYGLQKGGTSQTIGTSVAGFIAPPRSDLMIQATTDTNNTTVSASMTLLIMDMETEDHLHWLKN